MCALCDFREMILICWHEVCGVERLKLSSVIWVEVRDGGSSKSGFSSRQSGFSMASVLDEVVSPPSKVVPPIGKVV